MSDSIFEEIINENYQELSEILIENPEKFSQLGLIEISIRNSLTNKIKTVLSKFKDKENDKTEKIFGWLRNLCLFDYYYKINRVAEETLYCRKYFLTNHINQIFFLGFLRVSKPIF